MNPADVHIGTMDCLIVWIRRELRIDDHLALYAALQDARKVVPLFIIDKGFHASSPAKKKVVLDGLADLRSSLKYLGGNLVIRNGDPSAVLHALLDDTSASGVYLTGEFSPDLRLRDEKIRSSVESRGKLWREFHDHLLLDGERILQGRSSPYTVYTAFRRAWRDFEHTIPPSLPKIRRIVTPGLPSDPIPDVVNMLPGAALHAFPPGGESAALNELESFLSGRVMAYHEKRDFPALEGTSRLSHHLSTGSAGVRTVYHKLMGRSAGSRGLQTQGPARFLDELIWREFYYQILANFPRVTSGSFKTAYDQILWPSDKRYFDAWCAGMTGYPIVDAAMRQLRAEGWMHNRTRMIVASFLIKDLHVDWRKGEEYFMQHLADGDVALNNGGWQWCAGSGNDAQPWFRMFNPVSQSRKFDPHGEYITSYLPEIRRVPEKFVHEPWLMPPPVQQKAGCRIGTDYPAPIVDHARERVVALEMYRGLGGRQFARKNLPSFTHVKDLP